MRVTAERAVLALARPWVAEWDGIALDDLRPSLRAAALARAAALRGAYRDLAPRAVPGVAECADLHSTLGCDRLQSRLAGDALVARVLRSPVIDPEPGTELAFAAALELLAPLLIDRPADLAAARHVRFGRDEERLDVITRGERTRLPLRGRVALYADANPCAAPGVLAASSHDDTGGRPLRIVAFASAASSPAETEARLVSIVGRLLRRPPTTCGFAASGVADHRQ